MRQRLPSASALAASILLFAACPQAADASTSFATPGGAPSPGNATASARHASTADNPRVSSIVSPRSIGASRDFVERRLGQPVDDTPETARYSAGGCDISVEFGEDGTVSAVGIALANGCRFDASALAAGRSLAVDGTLTFARFEQLFGEARYSSPCLASCGNAFDSFVDAVVHGDGAIEVAAQTLFVGDAAVDASDVWQDRLTADTDEDFVLETKFNCVADHDAIPRAAFAEVRVELLRFGRDLGTADCP